MVLLVQSIEHVWYQIATIPDSGLKITRLLNFLGLVPDPGETLLLPHFTCRFLALMSKQEWTHGGYWTVVHQLNSNVFLKMLRTRCGMDSLLGLGPGQDEAILCHAYDNDLQNMNSIH